MLHIIFLNFVRERNNIFLSFALIRVLIAFTVFNGYTFILLFPGPVSLDLGDAIPGVAYVPTVSSLHSIISDVTKEYLTQMVRKRKYRRYLDTYSTNKGLHFAYWKKLCEDNKLFWISRGMIPWGVSFYEPKIRIIQQNLHQNRKHLNTLFSGPGRFECWKKLEVENLDGLSY